MRHFLLLLCISVFASAFGKNSFNVNDKNNFSQGVNQSKKNFTFKVISVPNNKWGYDIYKNNKIFIHQTNIPGLPGTVGFRCKSDAKKIAQLVITKLKNGVMPPAVTKNELELLKVI
jgi:hypothetical protein